MSEKKKILIFIDWFLPGYKAGGPIRSVANMVDALHEYFDFHIITSDRDLGDTNSYKNINLNEDIQKDTYKIRYLTIENQTIINYKAIFAELKPSIIYFNSLFSYKFTLLPLYISKKYLPNISIILAPRGMLGEGALGLKSIKKSIFLSISKIIKLYFGIKWHATTLDEKQDINRVFGNKSNIFIAGNIAEFPSKHIVKEKISVTKFVFISRISKKKNILFAIEILQKLQTKKKIIFDIFGPVEDGGYKMLCERAIARSAENIEVNFKREIKHLEVKETLNNYHFFLFPTLHENFGHSIFESLSSGCPVITSDQTPWRKLEVKNIGWDIALSNEDKFIDTIQKCIDMSQEDYDKMSENAFNYAIDFSNNSEAIINTKKLFEND